MFYNIKEAKNLLATTEITAPRLDSKETCSSNIAISTPRAVLQKKCFYPFLDNVIEEFIARFASYAIIIGNLQMLVSGFFIDDARPVSTITKFVLE